MRKLLILTLLTAGLATPLLAQQRINVDLPGLADRATEVVDVTLDAQMLRLASKFLSDDDADEKQVREMVAKLDGIYVKSYQFDKDWDYDRKIVDSVRAQLGPAWKRIVDVRSKLKENAEVYVETRGDTVIGLVVISAEPRELTVVNIVGPIDLDKLTSMEGQFGIPRVSKTAKKEKNRE